MKYFFIFFIVLHCSSTYSQTTFEWIIKPEYDRIFNFSEGLSVVVKNGMYGFIDTSGKIVIDIKYQEA